MGFFKRVLKNIEDNKLIDLGDKVIVGLSGGPDSMAILDVLLRIKDDYGLEVFVCHINHMLRKEADKEEEYVREFAEKNNLGFFSKRIDIDAYAEKNRLSTEEAGHLIRKREFLRIKKEKGFDKLVLGHHADDRVETFFMHLLKGAGTKGLISMGKRNGWIIRPLYNLSKRDILDYCAENGIRYFVDRSNLEPIYLRNRIRLNLIPELRREYNPKIDSAILKTIDILEEEEKVLGELRDKYYSELVQANGSIIKVSRKVNEIPKGIQRRVLMKIVDQISSGSLSLSFEKIEKILDMNNQKKGKKYLDLSKDIKLEFDYEYMVFFQRGSEGDLGGVPPEVSEEVILPFERKVGSKYILISDSSEKEEGCVCLDLEKLSDKKVVLRTRRDGDIIKPKGGKTKKLKKYMMEKKIDRKIRDRMLVLATDNEVIWVEGLTFSDNYLVDDKTKRYYKICVKNS